MPRSSPGVRRVAAILNFMADHPGQAFTLTDLVRALRLSRATCHALLTGLVEVGYLYRASDKNYILGPALASIGRIAAEFASPLQVAQPEMRKLADEFDAVCAAFFRDRDEIVVRDRAASVSHVGWSLPLGARLKTGPFGAVFQAWRPEAEAKIWLDAVEADAPAGQRQVMLDAMTFLRANGYLVHVRSGAGPPAADRQTWGSTTSIVTAIDDAADYPLAGVLAPVFELRGQIAFMLGLSGFGGEIVSGAAIRAIAGRLLESCDRVSHFITGRPMRPLDDEEDNENDVA